MNIRELLRRALFFVGVPKCPSCGEKMDIDDGALCKNCFDEYIDFTEHDCSLCSKPLSECSCTNKYLESHSVRKLYKVVRYRPGNDTLPSNKLIYSLKRSHRADVIDFIASEIAESMRNSGVDFSSYIFTNVPRRRAAVRQYGYDHARELSRRLAKEFGAEHRDLLISRVKRAQKKLFGRERIKNINFDYKGKYDLEKRNVILVDDLVTTGASMGAAAMLLKMSGAKRVFGACFAIAYKDNSIQF